MTVALFAPYNTVPGYKLDTERAEGEVLVTADYEGRISVYLNLPSGRAPAKDAPWWADTSPTKAAA